MLHKDMPTIVAFMIVLSGFLLPGCNGGKKGGRSIESMKNETTIPLQPGEVKRYSVKSDHPIKFVFTIDIKAGAVGLVGFHQYDSEDVPVGSEKPGCAISHAMPSTTMTAFTPINGWVNLEITNGTKERVIAKIREVKK